MTTPGANKHAYELELAGLELHLKDLSEYLESRKGVLKNMPAISEDELRALEAVAIMVEHAANVALLAW